MCQECTHYSVTSSRTMSRIDTSSGETNGFNRFNSLTKSSKPRSVPVNSRSLFMITQILDPIHLSMSSVERIGHYARRCLQQQTCPEEEFERPWTGDVAEIKSIGHRIQQFSLLHNYLLRYVIIPVLYSRRSTRAGYLASVRRMSIRISSGCLRCST